MGIFNDAYMICFLLFFIKTYVVGTHLNYFSLLDKALVVFKQFATHPAVLETPTKRKIGLINCLFVAVGVV